MIRTRHTLAAVLWLSALPLFASEEVLEGASEGSSGHAGAQDSSTRTFAYEPDRGLVFRQGATDLWLGLRGQFRYNNTATELDT